MLGADGFIGSHLTQIAAASGADVVAACIKDDWRLRDIGGIEKLKVPDGRWWSESFTAALVACLDRCDALALLAYTPPPTRDETEREEHERRVNLAGVIRVVTVAVEHGVRVVLASSADVYGPWHETPIGEDVVPSPVSPYGRAKLDAELALGELARSGSGGCSLRLATVFGPGENGPRAIPSFIRAYLKGDAPEVHGDGSDMRDYVHVRDVARAFLAACLGGSEVVGPINVGSCIGRTTTEILEAVAAVLGRQPDARRVASPRSPTRVVLDPDRAHRLLGFVPSEPFADGLAEEAAWLRRRLEVRCSEPSANQSS